ncbi:MAG: phosphotransferase [Jatrophihabitantaceae bacterium]
MSRLHVFKIGTRTKLQREYDSIINIAYVIDNKTPRATLWNAADPSTDLALLRSEFVSDSPVESLRDHLRRLPDPATAASCLNDLFARRMRDWHYRPDTPVEEREKLGKALDWWVDRRRIIECANFLGRLGCETLVQSAGGLSITELATAIEAIADEEANLRYGVVHGDLHTQNVLLDGRGKVYLIDFGWTAERWRAIDFLMMESSLKYLVAPRSAHITDLLEMDQVIDGHSWGAQPDVDAIDRWSAKRMFGKTLALVTSAVVETRRHAALSGAVLSAEQYRKGLALLGAGLTSMPPKINLALVLASTAYQVKQLR